LKGECSQEEEFILFNWYDSFERDADAFDSLSESQAREIKERMFSRIKANANLEQIHNEDSLAKPPIARTLWYRVSGVAALLLMVFALFYYKRVGSNMPSESITVNNLSRCIHKIVLADGSIVWLSPQSKIRYPGSFEGESRMVSMEGEAFFEITRDPEMPFIINSGNVITKVLGTSFRIKSFHGTNSTEVSVLTGNVSVSIPGKEDDGVMILPSHKVTYLRDKQLFEKGLEDKSSSMRIWEKITMSFENTFVSEVIKQLNKKFGVNITVNNPQIAEYVLNADFTNQSLPAILQMLEKSLNVTYTINEETITLNKKI